MLGIESSQVDRDRMCMTKYFPSLSQPGREGHSRLATVRPLGSKRSKKRKQAKIKINRQAARRLASMPSMIHFKMQSKSELEDDEGGKGSSGMKGRGKAASRSDRD